ncbi:MAG: N-acetylmuramic acid 6-phosphate etherase [Oscillatoriales cyanobacterium SM2_1_8]|nr:N-acetylmuramic acid 6-phosphate etherase [Oscillatoriales cyanobacterium SM2_1_8]
MAGQQGVDRGHLLTEQPNPRSTDLDLLSPLEFVDLCQAEDEQALQALVPLREDLARAIALVAAVLGAGGRLFYVGAGTSGRLGVLDAAECPPTFCTPPDMVQGILAGGVPALVRSSEALEDRYEDGARAVAMVTARDAVMGIAAGGTTPYVLGALAAARSQGARTLFLACVPREQAPCLCDVDLRPLVGPEILTGSTRLKAGTVTKLILNRISTGAMVALGKVYGNRMVEVAVTNAKLRDRAERVLMDLGPVSREVAAQTLRAAGDRVKVGLLMIWTGRSPDECEASLAAVAGNLRLARQRWEEGQC